MSRPVTLPFPTLIELNRSSAHPIYLQIVNQFIKLIQHGTLVPGARLPGARKLSQSLGIHRNTVVKALEELQALGWIEIKPNRGAFVVESFPLSKPAAWSEAENDSETGARQSFEFYSFPDISLPYSFDHALAFDDGLPDIRLAPIDELARAYSRNMRYLARKKALTYTDATGNKKLKKQLVSMLNETRGLHIAEDQVLITRGTIMAINLAVGVTVRKGDHVVVGKYNYRTVNTLFNHVGAIIHEVPVDEQGIDVDELEELLQTQEIRALYLTSHHYHPTTVTLSPERRLKLLQLAKSFNFVILEDDYDYDYHYNNTPFLPLASGDHDGRVFYLGSFTKVVAPAFRVGYLVGPSRAIRELPRLRRLMDRQGDLVMEQSIADLMEEGTMRRHLRKSWKQYKERRDYCCKVLQEDFLEVISFQAPAGGMAVWAKFHNAINLPQLSRELPALGLHLSSGTATNSVGIAENSCRLGFASLNIPEMKEAFSLLRRGISQHH